MNYVALQIEAHEAHKARLARMQANAVEIPKPAARASRRDRLAELYDRWEDHQRARQAQEADAAAKAELEARQAQEMLEAFERQQQERRAGRPTIAAVQAAVCRMFHISRENLLSHRRGIVLIIPRHVAVYLCRTMTDYSLPEIGRGFAGRDHSTILSSVRRCEVLMERNSYLKEKVERIRALLERKAADAA